MAAHQGASQYFSLDGINITNHIAGPINHTGRDQTVDVTGLGDATMSNQLSGQQTYGFAFELFANATTDPLFNDTDRKMVWIYGARGSTTGLPRETATGLCIMNRVAAGASTPQKYSVTIIPDDSGSAITVDTF